MFGRQGRNVTDGQKAPAVRVVPLADQLDRLQEMMTRLRPYHEANRPPRWQRPEARRVAIRL